MKDFEEFIVDISHRMQQFEDAQASWETAVQITHEMGGSALNVGVTSASGKEVLWGRSSMTEAWLTRYNALEYHRIDPFLRAILDGDPEIMVDCGTLPPDNPAYPLNRDLKKFGYGSLFATCSRNLADKSRSMVVFCSAHTLAEVDRDIGFDRLRIVNAILASHILTPGDLSADGFINVGQAVLTAKERAILSLLAEGLRNDQIAFTAKIAEVTVRKHLSSIRAKLRADTREQAVAIAVRRGLIPV